VLAKGDKRVTNTAQFGKYSRVDISIMSTFFQNHVDKNEQW